MTLGNFYPSKMLSQLRSCGEPGRQQQPSSSLELGIIKQNTCYLSWHLILNTGLGYYLFIFSTWDYIFLPNELHSTGKQSQALKGIFLHAFLSSFVFLQQECVRDCKLAAACRWERFHWCVVVPRGNCTTSFWISWWLKTWEISHQDLYFCSPRNK